MGRRQTFVTASEVLHSLVKAKKKSKGKNTMTYNLYKVKMIVLTKRRKYREIVER